MKRIAILQSNYIPWKGYFDLIAYVDEFILYDDMQFTKRDWRNRNQIKTQQGTQWLTIPVNTKGKYHQKIREVEVSDDQWAVKHWQSIEQNYKKTPYFADAAKMLEPQFLSLPSSLSALNRSLIETICKYLKITTKITNSWDYDLVDGKTERLAALCKQAGGTVYVSGPSAKDYMDEIVFVEMGIEISWFDYQGYPEYPQLWGEFVHGVTILDLLFNCGPDSHKYMRYVGA